MSKAPRLADLDPDNLTADQQPVYDAIKNGTRGVVVGPLRVWLTSPRMAEKAQALGQYARYDSVLPPALSELAILVTARYWSAGFEWVHHAPIALAEGISPDVVTAISHAKIPILSNERQNAVFNCAVELHRDRQISDVTFAQGLAALGEQGMVDLVAVCGYYTLISMTINAFHVPDGDGPQLPELPLPVAEYFRA